MIDSGSLVLRKMMVARTPIHRLHTPVENNSRLFLPTLHPKFSMLSNIGMLDGWQVGFWMIGLLAGWVVGWLEWLDGCIF